MVWLIRFLASSIGAKVLVALTGLVLAGFVLFHMLGNFNMYVGPDAMNSYAAAMKSNAGILWGGRSFLLVAVGVHILMTLRLAKLNRNARPEKYAKRRPVISTLASRTMVLTGLVVLAFVVYHLLHFTVGATHPEHFNRFDAAGRHDVYTMFVLGFQNVGVSVSYIIAMVLLGFHLNHGVSSIFQSVGLTHPRYESFIKKIGPVFAAVIVIGNISLPVAVLAGWIAL